jgi:hypothetical protein
MSAAGCSVERNEAGIGICASSALLPSVTVPVEAAVGAGRGWTPFAELASNALILMEIELGS